VFDFPIHTREIGVEPTNNFAERCLRPLVILRKLSFGTDSEPRSRFIERIFSVPLTAQVNKSDLKTQITTAVETLFLSGEYPRNGATTSAQPVGRTVTHSRLFYTHSNYY